MHISLVTTRIHPSLVYSWRNITRDSFEYITRWLLMRLSDEGHQYGCCHRPHHRPRPSRAVPCGIRHPPSTLAPPNSDPVFSWHYTLLMASCCWRGVDDNAESEEQRRTHWEGRVCNRTAGSRTDTGQCVCGQSTGQEGQQTPDGSLNGSGERTIS